MRSGFPILAALSILTLIATGCGAAPTPAFIVSSTPVPGYGGTPLSTSAATAAILNSSGTSTARATEAPIPGTGGTATTAAPSSGGAYGGGGYGNGGGAAATQAPSSGGLYGGGASTTQSVPSTGATGTGQIAVANNPRLGSILVDGSGKTLYVLTKDTPNTSTCYDGCSQLWPPLVASSGSPNAGAGVDGSMIATAIRTDGTTQVTYNGWPLYYFSGDKAPGDTNGQGLKSVWFAVSADGNPVKSP
jgi:predicted lipoprotein with Yx(FWY)xxD motif